MAKFAPPPGTGDIFPEEARRWRGIEQTAAGVFSSYNFGELRTPIFEYTEVFHRGLGDETEVVKKEMYTFEDRGGRSLTLRPEGTAGVMRALLNTDVLNGVEQRVYYCGPMFRGERPAAGRRRQFHQIGAECVGRVSPELDVECIAMLWNLLKSLSITGCELLINTRGVAADRVEAVKLLRDYFSSHIDDMCDDCRERLQNNVWRILDCKQENCRKIIAGAPDYLACYTSESREYFSRVLAGLDMLGVRYRHDPLLVRGLDYYVHTVFEVTHPGVQGAIAGGGRYELYLPEQSRPVVGVGFAAGMERLMIAQDALGVSTAADPGKLVYLIGLGHDAILANLALANELRAAGLRVECEVEDKSMKAQMRTANRIGAAVAVITGSEELAAGNVVVRNLADGSQTTVVRGDAAAKCIEILSIQDKKTKENKMTITKKNLIFLGGPGSGKGTMSAALMELYPLAHISTGDLLRDEIKRDTELGRAAAGIMKNGGLVPDDVVCGMVRNRLAQPDCANGFILDGFPRTIAQAEKLNQLLAELGKKVEAVINIVVPDDVILQRLTSRLCCKGCSEIYNKLSKPPKKAGVCDKCGGELYQRPDDSLETAKQRLEVFYKNTSPLIEYYRNSGLLYDITGNEIAEKLAEITAALA